MSNPDYILKDQVSTDAERLTLQYKFFRVCLGRDTALPASVDPTSLSRVLDVAAGSLAWTLELAALPAIKSRIESSQVELYACDLTDAQFPAQDILNGAKIVTFIQDVTVPFPVEMHGTFDLVNMRLLTMALTKERWVKAIKNLREILKPNGRLLLFESPLIYFHPDKPLKPSEQSDRFSWIDGINLCMEKSWYDKRNYVQDFVEYLPALLRSEGFKIEEETAATIPFGILCRTHNPAIAAFEEFSIEGYVRIFTLVFRSYISQGTLEGPKGLMNETDLQELMNAFRKGLEDTGAEWHSIEVVARRLD